MVALSVPAPAPVVSERVPVPWWAYVAFALALVLLATAALRVWRENRAAAESARWMLQTHDVLAQLGELDSALTRLESRHRGFLITGDAMFLDGRAPAERHVDGMLADLSRRLAEHPLQVQRLQALQTALEARRQGAAKERALAVGSSIAAARAAFASHAFEPVRTALVDLRRAEDTLLQARSRAAIDGAAALQRMLLLVGACALLLLLAASAAVLAQLRRLLRAGHANRKLAATLQAQAAALAGSNRELESFSYSVSHDLRAPLRHIHGYAQMLEEDAADRLDGEPRRYLAEIRRSSKRMGMLIDDLLALSRLGRAPMREAEVDMEELVAAALAELPPSPGSIEVDALPTCRGDAALLRQAWINLLSNAIKYSAPRGAAARITVRGQLQGDGVRYEVADNGVGFDERYAGKLFAAFQRLHSAEQFEGTGIGLAIVHRIVSRHGGSVEARGRPDAGACFSFSLPHAPPLPESAPIDKERE